MSDINLTIYSGEVLALIGANGAGKTVFTEIVTGLIFPDDGTVNYFFENHQKEIGMQFQDSEIKGNLNAIDLIKFYKRTYRSKNISQEDKCIN